MSDKQKESAVAPGFRLYDSNICGLHGRHQTEGIRRTNDPAVMNHYCGCGFNWLERGGVRLAMPNPVAPATDAEWEETERLVEALKQTVSRTQAGIGPWKSVSSAENNLLAHVARMAGRTPRSE